MLLRQWSVYGTSSTSSAPRSRPSGRRRPSRAPSSAEPSTTSGRPSGPPLLPGRPGPRQQAPLRRLPDSAGAVQRRTARGGPGAPLNLSDAELTEFMWRYVELAAADPREAG